MEPSSVSTKSLPHTDVSSSRESRIGYGVTWAARWSGRWLLVALATVVLGFVVRYSWSILLPLLLALILTTVLEPPARKLEERLRARPALAALLVVLGSFALALGTVLALIGAIGAQAPALIDETVKGFERIRRDLHKSGLASESQSDAALQDAARAFPDGGGTIASGILAGAGAASSVVVTTVIVLVLTFFFLKDGRGFLPLVQHATGPVAGAHIGEVLRRSWEALGGYIRAQALVSLIDAILIGIALLVVGVPLALPVAVLTFMGGFVPIVGAVAVGAVAVLVALAANGLTGALIILAVVIAVQALEGNILSPWLQSKTVRLHPAVVLLVVALGSTLFGIAGAFLAVPAAAVAAVVLRYLDNMLSQASPS